MVGAFSVIVKTDCCRWIVCSPGCCRQVPGSVLHGAGETHRCWSWSDHSDSPLPISRHSTSTSRQRKGHQTSFNWFPPSICHAPVQGTRGRGTVPACPDLCWLL